MTAEMSRIKNDFLPEELEIILKQHGFEGSVVVQSSQVEEENFFQLGNAEEFDFIKGVVGWVDLRANDIEERLDYYSSFRKLKGFRHVLQGEKQRDLMLSNAFMNGIGKLQKYGFTYDILIFADQLQYLPAFVSAFPNQKFVIDHIAKPAIRENEIRDWGKGIQEIAKFENVHCKISGMLTEADWHHWQPGDFVPYIELVLKAFPSLDSISFTVFKLSDSFLPTIATIAPSAASTFDMPSPIPLAPPVIMITLLVRPKSIQ